MTDEVDMTDRRNWKPIDAETILGAPIVDIGKILDIEHDNESYAIDADGKYWVCGWFLGKFSRVQCWPKSPEVESND